MKKTNCKKFHKAVKDFTAQVFHPKPEEKADYEDTVNYLSQIIQQPEEQDEEDFVEPPVSRAGSFAEFLDLADTMGLFDDENINQTPPVSVRSISLRDIIDTDFSSDEQLDAFLWAFRMALAVKNKRKSKRERAASTIQKWWRVHSKITSPELREKMRSVRKVKQAYRTLSLKQVVKIAQIFSDVMDLGGDDYARMFIQEQDSHQEQLKRGEMPHIAEKYKDVPCVGEVYALVKSATSKNASLMVPKKKPKRQLSPADMRPPEVITLTLPLSFSRKAHELTSACSSEDSDSSEASLDSTNDVYTDHDILKSPMPSSFRRRKRRSKSFSEITKIMDGYELPKLEDESVLIKPPRRFGDRARSAVGGIRNATSVFQELLNHPDNTTNRLKANTRRALDTIHRFGKNTLQNMSSIVGVENEDAWSSFFDDLKTRNRSTKKDCLLAWKEYTKHAKEAQAEEARKHQELLDQEDRARRERDEELSMQLEKVQLESRLAEDKRLQLILTSVLQRLVMSVEHQIWLEGMPTSSSYIFDVKTPTFRYAPFHSKESMLLSCFHEWKSLFSAKQLARLRVIQFAFINWRKGIMIVKRQKQVKAEMKKQGKHFTIKSKKKKTISYRSNRIKNSKNSKNSSEAPTLNRIESTIDENTLEKLETKLRKLREKQAKEDEKISQANKRKSRRARIESLSDQRTIIDEMLKATDVTPPKANPSANVVSMQELPEIRPASRTKTITLSLAKEKELTKKAKTRLTKSLRSRTRLQKDLIDRKKLHSIEESQEKENTLDEEEESILEKEEKEDNSHIRVLMRSVIQLQLADRRIGNIASELLQSSTMSKKEWQSKWQQLQELLTDNRLSETLEWQIVAKSLAEKGVTIAKKRGKMMTQKEIVPKKEKTIEAARIEASSVANKETEDAKRLLAEAEKLEYLADELSDSEESIIDMGSIDTSNLPVNSLSSDDDDDSKSAIVPELVDSESSSSSGSSDTDSDDIYGYLQDSISNRPRDVGKFKGRKKIRRMERRIVKELVENGVSEDKIAARVAELKSSFLEFSVDPKEGQNNEIRSEAEIISKIRPIDTLDSAIDIHNCPDSWSELLDIFNSLAAWEKQTIVNSLASGKINTALLIFMTKEISGYAKILLHALSSLHFGEFKDIWISHNLPWKIEISLSRPTSSQQTIDATKKISFVEAIIDKPVPEEHIDPSILWKNLSYLVNSLNLLDKGKLNRSLIQYDLKDVIDILTRNNIDIRMRRILIELSHEPFRFREYWMMNNLMWPSRLPSREDSLISGKEGILENPDLDDIEAQLDLSELEKAQKNEAPTNNHKRPNFRLWVNTDVLKRNDPKWQERIIAAADSDAQVQKICRSLEAFGDKPAASLVNQLVAEILRVEREQEAAAVSASLEAIRPKFRIHEDDRDGAPPVNTKWFARYMKTLQNQSEHKPRKNNRLKRRPVSQLLIDAFDENDDDEEEEFDEEELQLEIEEDENQMRQLAEAEAAKMEESFLKTTEDNELKPPANEIPPGDVLFGNFNISGNVPLPQFESSESLSYRTPREKKPKKVVENSDPEQDTVEKIELVIDPAEAEASAKLADQRFKQLSMIRSLLASRGVDKNQQDFFNAMSDFGLLSGRKGVNSFQELERLTELLKLNPTERPSSRPSSSGSLLEPLVNAPKPRTPKSPSIQTLGSFSDPLLPSLTSVSKPNTAEPTNEYVKTLNIIKKKEKISVSKKITASTKKKISFAPLSVIRKQLVHSRSGRALLRLIASQLRFVDDVNTSDSQQFEFSIPGDPVQFRKFFPGMDDSFLPESRKPQRRRRWSLDGYRNPINQILNQRISAGGDPVYLGDWLHNPSLRWANVPKIRSNIRLFTWDEARSLSARKDIKVGARQSSHLTSKYTPDVTPLSSSFVLGPSKPKRTKKL